MRWLTFVEPFTKEKALPVYCFIDEETAIEAQKEAAAQSGHIYESNEDALDDFRVVHWASWCKEPKWDEFW